MNGHSRCAATRWTPYYVTCEYLLQTFLAKIAASTLNTAQREGCLQELEEGLTGYTYLED